MLENINSGEDYAKVLVGTITESKDDFPEMLIKYWCEEIWDLAVKSYNDYIVGKIDNYLLTDADMEEAYDRAGLKYTQNMVDDLVDKDMLQVSINEEGELLYSLTEKGKHHTL